MGVNVVKPVICADEEGDGGGNPRLQGAAAAVSLT